MQVIFVQTDVLDLNTGNECGEEREIEKEREREREGGRKTEHFNEDSKERGKIINRKVVFR